VLTQCARHLKGESHPALRVAVDPQGRRTVCLSFKFPSESEFLPGEIS
jgi:hypothetical protein